MRVAASFVQELLLFVASQADIYLLTFFLFFFFGNGTCKAVEVLGLVRAQKLEVVQSGRRPQRLRLHGRSLSLVLRLHP